jgi:hypothetical protein
MWPSCYEESTMSPERAKAYRRVIHTLDELGPTKLLDREQEAIREAADTLIFSRDLGRDGTAREALADVELLCGALIESGRWERVTADRLLDNVSACGPGQRAELKAA